MWAIGAACLRASCGRIDSHLASICSTMVGTAGLLVGGCVSSSKIQSKRSEEPSAYATPVDAQSSQHPQQLADGTRDHNIQSTKGLRISTRCETVEQFVATYHPVCEDSTIFI